jgi:hypothetical protein
MSNPSVKLFNNSLQISGGHPLRSFYNQTLPKIQRISNRPKDIQVKTARPASNKAPLQGIL